MAPREGLRILANRGASGIDGLVSTALGVAAAGSPTIALIGDLSILHDIGALAWNAGRAGRDLTLVVIHNGGGALFAQLPQRDLPEFDELFATPHGADIVELARAAGATCFVVEKAAELEPALEAASVESGIRLVL